MQEVEIYYNLPNELEIPIIPNSQMHAGEFAIAEVLRHTFTLEEGEKDEYVIRAHSTELAQSSSESEKTEVQIPQTPAEYGLAFSFVMLGYLTSRIKELMEESGLDEEALLGKLVIMVSEQFFEQYVDSQL
jgi:hypothetical protein